jgi:hypothetical protein
MGLEHWILGYLIVSKLTLEDQMSRLKKLSMEDVSMTNMTTICPSVTSMVPKVSVPDT